jgi:hypothetical protein
MSKRAMIASSAHLRVPCANESVLVATTGYHTDIHVRTQRPSPATRRGLSGSSLPWAHRSRWPMGLEWRKRCYSQ